MKRFVAGADREQSTLLPECLDDFIDESNPVRVIDAFVDALDLADLGFDGVEPAATGRPAYHPSTLLKLYIYGYLNRQSSLFQHGAGDVEQPIDDGTQCAGVAVTSGSQSLVFGLADGVVPNCDVAPIKRRRFSSAGCRRGDA